MSRVMVKFWLAMLAIGMAIQGFLFYIEEDGPKQDWDLMTFLAFTIWSLLTAGFIGAIIYAYTEPYLSRKIKESRKH
jgi:nitrate reductase NapE component